MITRPEPIRAVGLCLASDGAVAGRTIDIEAIGDRRGRNASGLELAPAQFIDRDMPPRVVSRWKVGNLPVTRPLPGQVVMMQDRWASGEHLRDHISRGPIERKRADVLDHDQVGVVKGGLNVGGGGSLEVPHGHAGDDAVGTALTGNCDHVSADPGEGTGPLDGFDRNAVRTVQPKRKDGNGQG